MKDEERGLSDEERVKDGTEDAIYLTEPLLRLRGLRHKLR
jgi:hypothetical protein